MIDCEHAQKFDSVFPRIRTYAVNLGHVCNASSDLTLVAALFVEAQEIVQGSDDLIQLQSVLQSSRHSSRQRSKTFAAKLLQLPWLKALDTPPSSSGMLQENAGYAVVWHSQL